MTVPTMPSAWRSSTTSSSGDKNGRIEGRFGAPCAKRLVQQRLRYTFLDPTGPHVIVPSHRHRQLPRPGTTTYLQNGGTLEYAQQLANHESPLTTKHYDRTNDAISLEELDHILIWRQEWTYRRTLRRPLREALSSTSFMLYYDI